MTGPPPLRPTADRFVDTTLELIAEQGGSQGVNLREVARRIGCAHTNVYNYFDSYDDLLWSAFRRVLDDYAACWADELDESLAHDEYLRRLITDWGGTAVYADELPGDLDFLVLGQRPPAPSPLRDNATDQELQLWIKRRQALEKYDQLFRQAREAQIPVLNANRFFILIGHTER